jgi:hypothetical protein
MEFRNTVQVSRNGSEEKKAMHTFSIVYLHALYTCEVGMLYIAQLNKVNKHT